MNGKLSKSPFQMNVDTDNQQQDSGHADVTMMWWYGAAPRRHDRDFTMDVAFGVQGRSLLIGRNVDIVVRMSKTLTNVAIIPINLRFKRSVDCCCPCRDLRNSCCIGARFFRFLVSVVCVHDLHFFKCWSIQNSNPGGTQGIVQILAHVIDWQVRESYVTPKWSKCNRLKPRRVLWRPCAAIPLTHRNNNNINLLRNQCQRWVTTIMLIHSPQSSNGLSSDQNLPASSRSASLSLDWSELRLLSARYWKRNSSSQPNHHLPAGRGYPGVPSSTWSKRHDDAIHVTIRSWQIPWSYDRWTANIDRFWKSTCNH